MISVIVCVYNVEKYLERCVNSLLNQSFDQEYEIVLVDDGSVDSSGLICDDFAAGFSKVKVIHNLNEGSLKARFTGLGFALGEYVTFVDSDDYVSENYLSKLYLAITSTDSDVAMCNMKFIGFPPGESHNYTDRYISEKDLSSKLFPDMIFDGKPFSRSVRASFCDKIFKRDLLLKCFENIDYSIKIGEDASVVYPYMMEVRSAVQIPDELYCYVYNGSSQTHNYSPDYHLQSKSLYNRLMMYNDKCCSYDFTDQIKGNFVSMMVSCVGNLFQNKAPLFKVRWNALKEICYDDDLASILKTFDSSLFSKRAKFTLFLMKWKCVFLLFAFNQCIRILKRRR